jgi:2-oxoglutarate-Fe(II)-dependent oxygenase superfamily protein
MSQLTLFAHTGETVLVDDARGRILYRPDFVPAEVAHDWFDAVRGGVAWEARRDSVAPHNDHLDEIAPGCPIALLSLGATRRMTIRAKAAPRRVLHVDLAAGSLLLMSYETQLHYTHGVPKTTEPVGPRISLAFRVRLAPDERARQSPQADVTPGPPLRRGDREA